MVSGSVKAAVGRLWAGLWTGLRSRLLPGLSMALGLALALGATSSAHAARLLFIATSNVPPGKFRQLADIAKPHGITLELRYLKDIPAQADGSLFKGFDAVFIDSYLHDQVREHLMGALPALRAPQLWLHADRAQWSGWPDPLAQRLNAYYTSGGRANFEGFAATLAQHWGRAPARAIAPPVVFPKSAIYHPRAPAQVFATAQAYLDWLAPPPGKPVIALTLHQQYLASMQTGFVDDLIQRIESAGAVALPMYMPMLEPGALSRLVAPQGKPLAQAIINTQIMLNGELRRGEFEQLGLPVLQALQYRRGDEAAWRADPQGVTLADIPFQLAQPELSGAFDTQVAAATRADEQLMPIPAQAQALVDKALRLVALQRKPAAEKRLAVFFWNYPPGESHFGASFMNVPRSLASTLAALQAAGYRTEAMQEEQLIPTLRRLLAPSYRDGQLEPLLREGLADLLPVARYRRWLRTLPAHVQQELQQRFGPPERSTMVVKHQGQDHFVIPRLQLGGVALLPQPPRGERWDDRERTLFHSTKEPPSHFYLATYLWAREQLGADALVHFGTHGSQEWLPGKERGLDLSADYPALALGDLPVAYPYIADNIGEAMQARRRGRAVTISHQTPPFQPAGLHGTLTQLHDLLHAWLAQDEGLVKRQLQADLLAAVASEHLDRDMGWTPERSRADFPAFVAALHSHLHELAETAQPLGLHTLGRAPADEHRLATVLLMLGRDFWSAAAQLAGHPKDDLDEALVADHQQLTRSAPYALLRRHLLDGEPDSTLPAVLQPLMARARSAFDSLNAAGELQGLLTVLQGRHLPTSYGGDPIRNPDAYPTGRNLYGFDPSRVPTPQAWTAGREAAEQLIQAHAAAHGRAPRKLALSLWSVETMRQQGLLEAQAFALMGVEPVWDAGGRVTDVKLIPRQALGRARVDVVLSATGLYRDHFPNVIRLLARAVELAAASDEPDNALAQQTRALQDKLQRRGLDAAAARQAALTRVFSSESGRYGTGLDDATLATDRWRGKAEGDRKLAELYLSRMQYAYGPDPEQWGRADGAGRGVNLYAEALRGTEGAVLSRASNTYGMLTTDDPFQYLGGLALAVRHLDGKAPALYIANARGAQPRLEGAAGFLAKELATRNFHPGYIQGLMREGHAGTQEVLNAVNNFWGWTAVAREIVRDDQWQGFVDVYVRDKHQLGLRQWFEQHNPQALAQTMERMLEAARQGYWQADAATVRELRERYRDLAQRHHIRSDNAVFTASVGLAGFGLQAGQAGEPGRSTPAQPAPADQTAQPAQAAPPPEQPPAPQVRGMVLEAKAEPAANPAQQVIQTLTQLLAGAVLLGLMGLGAWRQRRV